MRQTDQHTSIRTQADSAEADPRNSRLPISAEADAIAAHILKNGVTVLPSGQARGSGGNRVTASGVASPHAYVFRREEQDTLSAERRLARAKLLTMFEDLAGRSKGAGVGQQEKFRNDAHRWFFGEGDFEVWCDAAGYAPEKVRERARVIKSNGVCWKWRTPPGEGKNYEKRKAARRLREQEILPPEHAVTQ